jgi:hypothetical protein
MSREERTSDGVSHGLGTMACEVRRSAGSLGPGRGRWYAEPCPRATRSSPPSPRCGPHAAGGDEDHVDAMASGLHPQGVGDGGERVLCRLAPADERSGGAGADRCDVDEAPLARARMPGSTSCANRSGPPPSPPTGAAGWRQGRPRPHRRSCSRRFPHPTARGWARAPHRPPGLPRRARRHQRRDPAPLRPCRPSALPGVRTGHDLFRPSTRWRRHRRPSGCLARSDGSTSPRVPAITVVAPRCMRCQRGPRRPAPPWRRPLATAAAAVALGQ